MRKGGRESDKRGIIRVLATTFMTSIQFVYEPNGAASYSYSNGDSSSQLKTADNTSRQCCDLNEGGFKSTEEHNRTEHALKEPSL